jgi:hypothetical protein
MKLDNGMYRALDLKRIRSMYILGKPPSDATIHEEGDGDLVSAETNTPDWDWQGWSTGTRGGNGNGGDPPPVCYWVNGVLICNGEPPP